MQTAVEWLYEILTTENWEYKTYEEQNEIFQKTKQMEKQQIIDAYFGGLNGSINDYSESKQVGSEIIGIKYGKGAEEYYNETYGSKGSDEVEFYKKELEDERNRVTSSQKEIEKLASQHYPEYYSIGLGSDKIGFERGYNLGISSQTEISDEEIENCVGNGMHDFYKGGFIEGAKWYREQLKSKQ